MKPVVMLVGAALVGIFGAALSPPGNANAEDYPTQLIKIVVPNPPGGPGDVITRAFAERTSQKLPKGFVVEYRAGASTTIGTSAVVKAKPDGYTLLSLPSAGLAVSVLRKKLPYNLETDLRPVIGVGSVPLALIVRAKLEFKTIDEFAAAARKGNLFYGSGGVGTVGHLTSLALLEELKGTATHVPFQGNPEVMQAIVSNSLDYFFGSIADAIAFSKSPEVQILGVTADRRVKGLESIPTMAELGLPKINSKLWYAFMAPSQTPADRINRLFDAFAEVAKDPALQQQLSTFGFNVEVRDADALSQMMKEEAARWKRLIEVNNIAINE